MRRTADHDQGSSPKRRRIALAFAALLFATASATIGLAPVSAQEPITIGIDANYPPYMFAKDGQPAGLYYDLIHGVFERMHMPVKIEPMPWTVAVQRTDDAEIGLGGLYKNDARLKKYDYSDPILDEKLTVFVRSGDEFEFDSLDDLRGRVVGVNKGWSYGQAFDEARANGVITAEEADSDTKNLLKLMGGQIDAAVVNSLAANMIINSRDDLKASIVELPNPVATNEAYLAFNKDADKKPLLEYFNYKLSDMKADGSFDKIFLTSVAENGIVSAE